jgi:uroporphyrinogen-III synthase
MLIAITRLQEKSTDDQVRCAEYGHHCVPVSPLRARVHQEEIAWFVGEVDHNAFDCIFFTSALPARLIGPRLSRWPRVVAIGPQTRRELAKFGIEAEVLDSYYSRDFVPYLGGWIAGKRIGIPRASVPNPDLLASIEAAGGRVTEVACYSLLPTGEPLPLGKAEALLFTSAMSYREACWEDRAGLLLVAIGEVTAGAMRSGGHPPSVVGDGSLEGTLQALNSYLEVHARQERAGEG